MSKDTKPRIYRGDLPRKWRSQGDRLLAGASAATWELIEVNGRPAVRFLLTGVVTKDIDAVIARLEGIRIGGARKAE